MPLTRKLRRVGNSLSLAIPGDFVAAMDLRAGDIMEVIPEGPGSFRIRKSVPKEQVRK